MGILLFSLFVWFGPHQPVEGLSGHPGDQPFDAAGGRLKIPFKTTKMILFLLYSLESFFLFK